MPHASKIETAKAKLPCLDTVQRKAFDVLVNDIELGVYDLEIITKHVELHVRGLKTSMARTTKPVLDQAVRILTGSYAGLRGRVKKCGDIRCHVTIDGTGTTTGPVVVYLLNTDIEPMR